MNATSHASYSFLIFSAVSVFLLGAVPQGGPSALAVAAGMLPDIDGLFWKLRHPGKHSGMDFQHHLMYPTHWPVFYLPLVAVTAITWLVDFYPMHFLAITMGAYLHLVFDSVSCGDGMNWGAPWGKRFVNLFSSKTDGYHGRYWEARFRTTIFFKVQWVGATIAIGLLAWFASIHVDEIFWYVVGIAVLVVVVALDLFPTPEIYHQEPPEGRYHDYRLKPGYYERMSPAMRERVKAWRESRGLPMPGATS
ncbi:MAG: metal-dependent hydrolase [Candidatus Lokiarchaeota archaeon]|nr:metal-dependent hydrolase [Candidatus Lokiarchaeota archaeon]